MAEESGGKSAMVNQEVEGDFLLVVLVTQLNDLATKFSEVQNQCKCQGRYVPLMSRQGLETRRTVVLRTHY